MTTKTKTAAKKTAVARKPAKKAAEKVVRWPNHRVITIPLTLREDLKTLRAERRLTVKDCYREAVEKVGQIVAALEALGLTTDDTRAGAVRVPFADESLRALSYASHQTKIDQKVLLAAARAVPSSFTSRAIEVCDG